MSPFEKQLVEDHLYLIPIMINALTRSCRLSYDEKEELTQISSFALCKAAMRYDKNYSFKSYAQTSIRNAIYDYWRKTKMQREHFCSLDSLMNEDNEENHGNILLRHDMQESSTEQKAMGSLSYEYLKYLEDSNCGIIKKGIASLILQQNGYTSTDLATICQVPSNHIRAWMSKARKELKENQELYELLA